MESKTLKLLGYSLLVACGLAGSGAHAVEPTVYQLGDAGAFAPHLTLEFGNDNNPLRAQEGSQETMYLRVEPRLTYLVQRRNNRLALGYTGEYLQYFEEYCQGQGPTVVRPGDCLQGSPTYDKASYQDHTLSLDGFLEVTSRVRLTLRATQEIEHQPLGTGLSGNIGVLNALKTPDNWSRRLARAQVSYGAFQARGEFRAGIALSDREFKSDRNDNFDAQSDNAVAPYAQILYRVGTRTQIFAGLGRSEVRDGVSFNTDGTVNENNERDISRVSFGAEIDSESVTSGSVSVSQVREDFLASNRNDLTYLGWDVSVIWRPRRYSTVTFSGGRQTESGVFRELSLSTDLGVNWVHFWRDRFSTRFAINHAIDENVDEYSPLDGTEDRSTLFRFEGNYNVRRWFDVGGFAVIDSRQGGENERDYARTVIGITANGTI